MGEATGRRALRFGVPGVQLPIRDVVRPARQAEEAGFDSIWWSDRLMGWLPEGPHALLDPFPVMAAAALATTSIRLGTAVADALRRHPVQLAQTALTLQHLSGGRLLLGAGSGEVAGTLPYGIPYERPVARLEEAIGVLRILWSGPGPHRFAGRFYRLDGAMSGLAERIPAPPVWLASHGPRALRLTGALADGWLPTAHGPGRYGAGLAAVRAAEAEAGRLVGSVEAGAFVWLVVAESRERARALLRAPGLRALGLLLPQGALGHTPLPDGPWGSLIPTDPRIHDLAAQIDPDELAEVLPVGTPEDVAEAVCPYIEAGAEHVVLCDMSWASGQDAGLGLRPLEIHTAIRDALLTTPCGEGTT